MENGVYLPSLPAAEAATQMILSFPVEQTSVLTATDIQSLSVKETSSLRKTLPVALKMLIAKLISIKENQKRTKIRSPYVLWEDFS